MLLSGLAGQAFATELTGLPDPLGPDDFIQFDAKQAELGQLLFYDKILSGNKNISCGTCHHHNHGGTDGLSLGIGEGGEGLGPKRTAGTGDDRIKKRIPRNAPGLWNLGAKEVRVLFHDGRLTKSDLYENGYNSPAEEWLPKGISNLLAAQALFPLTAQFEMAGNPKENQIAGAVHDRIDNAWPIIAKRVRTIPEYGQRFVEAFDHIDHPSDVTIVEIAEALAAFMGTEWQSFDSSFDDWLAGDETALNVAEKRGLNLFFGEAGCVGCHSGKRFTDQEFRALALPMFGPGRTRQWDPIPRDVGRMGESNRLEDMYRFRTPTLRNAELTAPYGHNGAYPTLESMIRHHMNPLTELDNWSREMANLPEAPWLSAVDFIIQSDHREMARHRSRVDISIPKLSENEIDDLVAFVKTLTGKSRNNRPMGIPESVPSRLPIDR